MKASDKHPEIDNFLSSITGKNRVEIVHHGYCMTCENDALEVGFRDPLSLKEYSISGMCQECQDSVFGGDEE